MSQPTHEILIEIFSGVIQQSAFLFVEGETDAGAFREAGRLHHVSMNFGGAVCGQVELVMPAAEAPAVAANMLGLEPTEIDPGESVDALKEMLNMTCGQLVSHLAGLQAVVDLSPPVVETFDSESWLTSSTGQSWTCLRVEDTVVALRLQMQEATA